MRKPIKLKDPIYGYIEITDDKVYSIINSPLFHRLQNITQTSYSSVYPSSVHNRFIHSIGVYYLGVLAVEGIKSNTSQEILIEDDVYKAFELACLLHDLGHSPFSHIGEDFFDLLKPTPWEQLKELLNDYEFDSDGKSKVGNPHEIMSALESVNFFSDKIPETQKAFFVRCIIGLRYSNKDDVRNCFIDLLNSKTIDVDKLDYLIRDSYYTGFKSVSIDYERLLSSVCIIRDSKNDDAYTLAFTKAALSTLESVVLAHDMERKWIQIHPTIQYENFLLTSIMGDVINLYKEQWDIDLFSLQALSEKGCFTKDVKIKLLSDADILFPAKTYLYDTNAVQEYFDRTKRRKALWKTEAEYKLYIENKLGKESCRRLEEFVLSAKQTLENFHKESDNLPLINDEFLYYIKSELEKISQVESSVIIDDKNIKIKKKRLQATLKLVNEVKNFSESKGYSFDYALILNKQFSSNFRREELKNIPIIFENDKIEKLEDALNLFKQEPPKETFFYLYVNKNDREFFNVDEFVNMLNSFIIRQ